VVREQPLGPRTQSFHHTRTKSLDEPVGGFAQITNRLDTQRLLEVDNHQFPGAREHILARVEQS